MIRGNPAARSQALRDLDSFRQMMTGPAFGTVFDLPWMPVFMIILFIIDPIIGLVTMSGADRNVAAIATALTVSAIFTKVMAIPEVNALLSRWGLGATPKKELPRG